MVGRTRFLASRTVLLIFFIVLGATVMFPFYFLLVSSFRHPQEMFASGFRIAINVKELTLSNYRMLFTGNG
ncbi:MAG TPA: hypothetical protein VMW87_02705, partial [Spirochaetia bacterium]|nr:hypothetical protein [Spirochaetia bacterium]